MRDVLIHDYIGVDIEEVWNVAASRIPESQDARCHVAREHVPPRRAAYLAEARGANSDLHREVEALLAEDASGEGTLDHLAAVLLARGWLK